jgi:hypothetical protein
MSFKVFIAAIVMYWLLTIALGVGGVMWSFSLRGFWPVLLLSVLGVLSSYLGLERIRITSSQTVNGHLQYSIDSRWFFMTSLGLSIVALGHALWVRWRTNRAV